MSDRKDQLDQMIHAAEGLGASACASALRRAISLAQAGGARAALDGIAELAHLSERTQTCLAVASKADNAGDLEMASLGYMKSLALMNHLAEAASAGMISDLREEEVPDRFARNLH